MDEQPQTIKLPRWFKHIFRRLKEVQDKKRIMLPSMQALSNEEETLIGTISSFIKNEHGSDLGFDMSDPISWMIVSEEKMEIAIKPPRVIPISHPRWAEVNILMNMGLTSEMVLHYVDALAMMETNDEDYPGPSDAGGERS